MPSPFPGMNPYLEQQSVFHDFHQTCMPIIRELLNAQLVPDFFAGLEVDRYIHELPAEQRRLVARADVAASARTSEPPPHPQDHPPRVKPRSVASFRWRSMS